jgi:glycosyltransferase involved in cell wall biosynthesis
MTVRVLGFCDYYSSAVGGGAEAAAREIYGRLVRDHDMEITVVGALARARSEPLPEPTGDNPRHVSVRGIDLTRLLGAHLMVSPSLGKMALSEARAWRPDVVHINGLHFHSTGAGLRVAKSFGLPAVATAHLADAAVMGGAVGLAAGLFDRTWARRAARRSNLVVAVSQAVSDHMVRLGVDARRIVVARNGVDLGRFYPPVGRERHPELRAVLVGRLVANKGAMLALDAVGAARARGRDVRLTVVGDGPLEALLRRRAARADLAGAVHFTGFVGDVESWLRRSDVTLRPSYTEGLPLAVLESLACGVPVVCSNVAGTLEVVRHASNGLVVPVGDAEALGTALVRLFDERTELERMSRAAVESARPFTWEASASCHLAAFEAALRGKSSARAEQSLGGN